MTSIRFSGKTQENIKSDLKVFKKINKTKQKRQRIEQMKSNNDEIDKLLAEKQWQVHECV